MPWVLDGVPGLRGGALHPLDVGRLLAAKAVGLLLRAGRGTYSPAVRRHHCPPQRIVDCEDRASPRGVLAPRSCIVAVPKFRTSLSPSTFRLPSLRRSPRIRWPPPRRPRRPRLTAAGRRASSRPRPAASWSTMSSWSSAANPSPGFVSRWVRAWAARRRWGRARRGRRRGGGPTAARAHAGPSAAPAVRGHRRPIPRNRRGDAGRSQGAARTRVDRVGMGDQL